MKGQQTLAVLRIGKQRIKRLSSLAEHAREIFAPSRSTPSEAGLVYRQIGDRFSSGQLSASNRPNGKGVSIQLSTPWVKQNKNQQDQNPIGKLAVSQRGTLH
ncbi:MAG: hypothetical protein LPH21_15640 [Shewanella sp.]|nr:hypothetical protein [Shewanella sp.]